LLFSFLQVEVYFSDEFHQLPWVFFGSSLFAQHFPAFSVFSLHEDLLSACVECHQLNPPLNIGNPVFLLVNLRGELFFAASLLLIEVFLPNVPREKSG
jgi:hypothetical protein